MRLDGCSCKARRGAHAASCQWAMTKVVPLLSRDDLQAFADAIEDYAASEFTDPRVTYGPWRLVARPDDW